MVHAMALGKGAKSTKEFVRQRAKTVNAETLAKGIQDRERGFRAAKNRPIAEPHQGAYFLKMTLTMYGYEIRKYVNNEWGSEEGAGGNVITPVQRELVVLINLVLQ